MRSPVAVICLLALTILPACRPDAQGDEATDPGHVLADRAALPPEVTAHLDSGSVAFRNDDFDEAFMHYERATEIAPDFGAAWFGVYMVERARGNMAAADEALARAQETMPGASLLHPTDPDTAR